MVVDESGMFIKSPNITRGPGSVVANYSEVDWVRTIRHGIKLDKHPMFLMPSADYNQLTNVDLAALIAYTRSLAPVAGEGAQRLVELEVRLEQALPIAAVRSPSHLLKSGPWGQQA